jgi:acyl carrier protein
MKTVKDRVLETIAEQSGLDVEHIKMDDSKQSLGFDSLDNVELIMQLEDEFEFEVPDSACESWKTVQDVIAYFERFAK